MCGRYSQRFSADTRIAGVDCDLPVMQPRYNTSPSQQGVIVRQNDDGKQYATLATWGFLPGWRQETGKAQINARSETLSDKPMFRMAFRHARCLVLMDGFIEWDRSVEPSRPYFVHRQDDAGFATAGIWASRKEKDRPEDVTYAVITTGSNTMMKLIHDRMPVILQARDTKTWLDVKTEAEILKRLLLPCPDDFLVADPISRRINSPANDTPDLLNPI